MSKLFVLLPLLSFLWVGCQKKDGDRSAGGQLDGETSLEAHVDVQMDPADLGFAERLPESVEFYASGYRPEDILMGLDQVDFSELMFLTEDEDDEGDETKGLSKDEQQKEINDAIQKINESMVKNAFVCIDHGMAGNIGTMGGCIKIFRHTR